MVAGPGERTGRTGAGALVPSAPSPTARARHGAARHQVPVGVVVDEAVIPLSGEAGAEAATALHAIAGLLPVRAGTITLAGQDVTHRSAPEMPALGLSLVQQGKRIFPGMTVEGNLLVATYPHKLRKAARLDLVAEAYERFPVLRDKRSAVAGSLSGGQQQMLAIGQSLMARPKVLMLDEPSAGLAPAIVKEVLRTVVSLAGDGLGILVVEQLVEDALAIAQEVVVLYEGAVSIAGDVATVSRDPAAHGRLSRPTALGTTETSSSVAPPDGVVGVHLDVIDRIRPLRCRGVANCGALRVVVERADIGPSTPISRRNDVCDSDLQRRPCCVARGSCGCRSRDSTRRLRGRASGGAGER